MTLCHLSPELCIAVTSLSLAVCALDLALLIDDSGSIKDANVTHWDELMSFVRKVVDSYEIGTTRIASESLSLFLSLSFSLAYILFKKPLWKKPSYCGGHKFSQMQ